MRGRSKKILIGILSVLIILGVVYAAALMRSKAQLREAYAALRRDGRPMRASDITPPDIPQEHNAAALYDRAIAMLTVPLPDTAEKDLLERLGRFSRAIFDEPTEPDKLARHQQRMTELKQRLADDEVVAALTILEEGTRRSSCRFNRQFTGVLLQDTPFSEPLTNGLRNLARVLGARAYFEAQSGRPQKAWATIQTLLRFSNMLTDDPLSVDAWVRLAALGQACRVIRELCEIAPPDPNTARAVESLLQHQDDTEPMVRALDVARLLHGEKLFAMSEDELYEHLRAEDEADGNAAPELMFRLDFRKITFAPTFIADHATYLRLMAKSVRLLQGPFVPREGAARREIDNLRWRYTLNRRLAPMPGIMKDIHCGLVANVQIARAGLGLLRYRHVHGQFPPSLDPLELEGLTDPYDGKPLRYRRQGNGFIVYSVDEDQKDNGGSPRQPKKKTDFDMVWQFPRQPDPTTPDAK